MTLARTRPMAREEKIPMPTKKADRPARCSPPPAFAPSVLIKVVVWRRLAERAARLLHEIRLDEQVDVAVEHTVHVAHLLLRTVVFHHLVRVQDVAADLAAERDLLLDAAN